MSAIATLRQPKYHNMPATSAQYFALEDDGFRYELIEGRLEVMPSPLTIHQHISAEILVEIKLFLRQHPIGEVYVAPLDVELGPIDTYQPDLLFIHNDNQDVRNQPRIHGTPELVVEVLSSSTKNKDFGVKFENYARFGVKEYWIIAPQTEEHHFYLAEDQQFSEVYPENNRYESHVIKGFVLDLEWLNDLIQQEMK
ncbi:Uma2 family endonuclease [Candidatus Poribacteria bacterium]|nr:Uma2 family endonuclease [Candidatus Poribacteria bacterium]